MSSERLEDSTRWAAGLCGSCGEALPDDRDDSREFCGGACRQRAYRARMREAKQAG